MRYAVLVNSRSGATQTEGGIYLWSQDMKMIQEWLGHSDFSTTANIYSHLDYASKVSSAEAMLNGLGMGSNPGNDT